MKVFFAVLLFVWEATGFQTHSCCRIHSKYVYYDGTVPSLNFKFNHTPTRSFPLHMTKVPENENDDTDEVKDAINEEGEKFQDAMKDLGVTGKIQETVAKAKVSSEVVEARKTRVITGYKGMAVGYSVMAGVIYALSRQPFYSAGPLLASGIAYIMIGAAENSRLSSDTYKRLNISLFEYGLTGLVAGLCMKLSPLWAFTCLVTIINSIKGYGYGLKGWELGKADIKEEILQGSKSNLESLAKIPNLKSAGYLLATLTVASFKVMKFLEVIKIVKDNGSAYLIGTRLFRLAQLMTFTIVMFTLKDAADRDRLEGTTFIELNFLSAVSFATWAWYEKITTPLGVLMMGLSSFSLWNGLASQMKKNKK